MDAAPQTRALPLSWVVALRRATDHDDSEGRWARQNHHLQNTLLDGPALRQRIKRLKSPWFQHLMSQKDWTVFVRESGRVSLIWLTCIWEKESSLQTKPTVRDLYSAKHIRNRSIKRNYWVCSKEKWLTSAFFIIKSVTWHWIYLFCHRNYKMC